MTEGFVLARWLKETELLSEPGMRTEMLSLALCASNSTKFPNIARAYYSGLSREIELIHLNGSIELAPLVGLSDVIVDIVETGKTLYENGLAPLAEIVDISARLIANKASFKFKGDALRALCSQMERTMNL